MYSYDITLVAAAIIISMLFGHSDCRIDNPRRHHPLLRLNFSGSPYASTLQRGTLSFDFRLSVCLSPTVDCHYLSLDTGIVSAKWSENVKKNSRQKNVSK